MRERSTYLFEVNHYIKAANQLFGLSQVYEIYSRIAFDDVGICWVNLASGLIVQSISTMGDIFEDAFLQTQGIFFIFLSKSCKAHTSLEAFISALTRKYRRYFGPLWYDTLRSYFKLTLLTKYKVQESCYTFSLFSYFPSALSDIYVASAIIKAWAHLFA